MNKWVRLVLRVAVLPLAALAIYQFVWLPEHVNQLLPVVDARAAEAEPADPTVRAAIARSNLDVLNSIAGPARTNVDYYIQRATNAELANDLEGAIAEYTAALAHADRRPELYTSRARLEIKAGHREAAIADMTQAARFRPRIIDFVRPEVRTEIQRRLRQNR